MYMEFTTEQFATLYPDMWKAMPFTMRLEFMSDPNYRFRLRPCPDGRTAVEIGYPEDEWKIKAGS